MSEVTAEENDGLVRIKKGGTSLVVTVEEVAPLARKLTMLLRIKHIGNTPKLSSVEKAA